MDIPGSDKLLQNYTGGKAALLPETLEAYPRKRYNRLAGRRRLSFENRARNNIFGEKTL